MGEAWSKDRLAPMLRDTPALRGRVADAKARDSGNTLRHKTYPGGHITVAGANSPASLASRPIRVLFCDEVDRYPASAGTEGDPVSLAKKRTATFWNRKIVLTSTPTITGSSRIEAAYEESDKRRFWVPCPECSEHQVLVWEQVRWSNNDPETAAYHCSSCGVSWTDADRWAAVRRGGWRAEKPFAGIAGFHLSELYSPWRHLSETVAEFISAKGSPERLKTFKNTSLGLSWQDAGEAPDWTRLIERREPFLMGVVPRNALVLTAGIDNQAQPERLEISVWAWAPGYESWLIDTRQIAGSPAANGPWDEIAKMLDTDWPVESGGTIRISRAAADTGGQHTAGVYTQLRRLRHPRLVPIKGVPGWNKSAPVNGPTMVDVTEAGRKIKRGLRLWTVAVDVFKSELYRRLWLSRGENAGYPAGWVHLPEGMDAEQVKQLVAEELVTVQDRRGFSKMEWKKTRANEQLDMCVYARAALSVLGSDRYGDRFWTRYAREAAEPGSEDEATPVDTPTIPPAAMLPVTQPKRSLASRLA
jgi:phage terminase large subunit GpA-like protein